MRKPDSEYVALLPAAGTGSRLGELPCSKELLPLIPTADDPFTASAGTRVAIEDSLQLLSENGVGSAYIIIAPGKEDIPAYLDQRPLHGMDIRFLYRESSPSVPHTLCSAIPHLRNRSVVLIFPDIVFRPRNIIKRTIEEHATNNADVTLALMPSIRGDKVDIVTAGPDGRVLTITPKPGPGVKGWTWITAVWSGDFSEFLQDFTHRPHAAGKGEIYVGDALNAAAHHGLSIGTLRVPSGVALDIGTPDDLKLLREGDFFSGTDAPDRGTGLAPKV